jgi:hypothetical protein
MKAITLLLMLAAALPCWARQDEDFEHLPGYIDLGQFLPHDKELTTEVEISNPLLSLVALATSGEDDDLSTMLNALKLIKVYSFKVDADEVSGLADKIKSADAKLVGQNWNRFVKVREGKEVTNVYMKMKGKEIVGLAVLSVDNHEASFVNIVGHIDLRSMNKLGAKFNIPKMDSIKTEKEQD